MVNLELLDRALALIDSNPGSWRQGSWAFCLAAKVADVTGAKRDGEYVDGRKHVSEYARRELGLDVFPADILFCAGNTRADLQAIRDVLASGAPWGIGPRPFAWRIDPSSPALILDEPIREEVLVTSVAG